MHRGRGWRGARTRRDAAGSAVLDDLVGPERKTLKLPFTATEAQALIELADSECPAGAPECFNVPMSEGKRCGGCKNDGQCAGGGCTFPNPYVEKGSYCGGGGAGEGCETNAACLEAEAPYCTPFMSKGILKVRTCSACRTNADCGALAPNCEPTLDLAMHLRGEMSCVANGALANGATCKNPRLTRPAARASAPPRTTPSPARPASKKSPGRPGWRPGSTRRTDPKV